MRRPHTLLFVSTLLVTALWLHRPFRGLALTVLRFPLGVVESVLSTLVWLPHLPSLVHENTSLRREAAARQLELIRLQETVRRATHVQQLLQAVPGLEDDPPTAEPSRKRHRSTESASRVGSIIGRTLTPTEHTVIVDRGTRDGIVPDTILLTADGVVGRVVEIHPTTSLAVLVTDPNSRIACLVDRSREFGLLVGTGGRFGDLLYIDLDADVTVGDQIVTAGLGGPFPKGVPLGTVVKVVRDEQAASVKVWVRPAVTLNRLEEVLCLLPAS